MTSFKRFDVFQVNLDPVIGGEIAKSHPCVIVSPDEMNQHLATVIVAPLTSSVKGWPSRVTSRFGGKRGEIALDQLRVVDKHQLAKHLGELDEHACAGVLTTLAAMFAA